MTQEELDNLLRNAARRSDFGLSAFVSGTVLPSGHIYIMVNGKTAGISYSNNILGVICEALEGCRQHVIIDLSQCLHLASYTLGGMAKLAGILKQRQLSVSIVDANAPIRDVMKLTGLDKVVEVYSSEDEALQALENKE